jgi:hypothetical protein
MWGISFKKLKTNLYTHSDKLVPVPKFLRIIPREQLRFYWIPEG